jgi:RHS repeat-associated protein
MNTRSTHSQTTSYSWDTSSELPELALETTSKGQGRHVDTDTTAYTYGAGPIGTETRRGSYTFHTDALGSVIALSDEHGKLVEAYRYTPYGESYGPGASDEAPAETSENPIRFTGQYLDSESGLYNMRAREYDPETGRCLETDPASCDEGGACGSVYVYVDDRPTVKTDPSGMCPIENATPTCMKGWKYPKNDTTKKRSSAKTLRQKAIKNARKALGAGVHEHPLGSNFVPGYTDWYKVGSNRPKYEAEWCAIAVSKWYYKAGSDAFKPNTSGNPINYESGRYSYVPNIRVAAEHGRQGLIYIQDAADAQAGDLILYGVVHVGLIVSREPTGAFETIEGNSGPDKNHAYYVWHHTNMLGTDYVRVTK